MDSGAGRRRTGLFGSFCWLASAAVISVVALTVWWLVHANGSLTLPRFSATGPVVRNGVAVIVACGKKSSVRRMDGTGYAPEPGTGTWAYRRRGDCTVWYHHPPESQQREARQQRAQQHADR